MLKVAMDAMVSTLAKLFKNWYARIDKLTLLAPKRADDIVAQASKQAGHITAFFHVLAICHTVLAEKPRQAEKPWYLEYKAESLDEAALVAAVRDIGFPFVGNPRMRSISK